MYKFKQDLAAAYFDGCSKKTASRLLVQKGTGHFCLCVDVLSEMC